MTRRYSLEMVVVVALFGIYALCAVLLCMIGIKIYQDSAQSMQENYDERTSLLYVVEKIRQNDIAGSVNVGTAYNNDAIVLTERKSGSNYNIWLYVKDGNLFEVQIPPGANPETEQVSPVRIMEMQSMRVKLDPKDDQSLTMEFTTVDQRSQSIDLWLRASNVGGA